MRYEEKRLKGYFWNQGVKLLLNQSSKPIPLFIFIFYSVFFPFINCKKLYINSEKLNHK